MNIALFDFDGTISSKDSFMLYTLYVSGWIKFVIGLYNKTNWQLCLILIFFVNINTISIGRLCNFAS